MNEKEVKAHLKSDKGVKLVQGTHGWSAYYLGEHHFMIGDAAGVAYRFMFKDPLTGNASWSQWKNIGYDKIDANHLDLLVSAINLFV